MLGIAFAIFILVEGVLLYAVLRFRRRKGHEGEGVPLHGSNRLELAWTVIPALIVFWLAAVSGQVIFRLDAPPEDALRVRVVARQFSWQFEYPEYGVSTSELNVPIDVPVELELISMDVIHSFWVPAFRLKQDALPMRETRLNFTATIVGEYPVVCAELCGAGHAVMRTRVFCSGARDLCLLACGGGRMSTRRGFIRHGAHRWVDYFTFNTDHKVIGVQYLASTLVFFLFAGLLALVIRYELLDPAATLNANAYNATFTLHGSVMIFLFVIPVMAGFANYLIPLMIGADDMAFPRLNALSFWLLILGGLTMVSGNFVGQADTGWTAYAPLSLQAPDGQTLWAIGAIIVGTSSTIGAINFLVTLGTMRTPGLTLERLPLFCWGMIATSIMVILATPVLTTALALLVLERMASMTFFAVTGGGDPLSWQNLFWFLLAPGRIHHDPASDGTDFRNPAGI